MKRRIISILAVCCMMVAMMPAAFAAGTTMDETEFRNAVAQGGTVEMTGDVTLNSTLTITSGVTIDGNGYTITYTPATKSYAFDVQTNSPVVFKDLAINATAGQSTNGISANYCTPDLTVDNVDIYVKRFGIALSPTGEGAKLNVLNGSTIKNAKVSDYATNVAYGDTRGISLWDADDAVVTITNSEIKGFSYSINVVGASLVGNSTNISTTISNSAIWGWSAFNIWTIGNQFNIINSDLRGINAMAGGSNNFGTIVLNSGIYGSSSDSNIFNFAGGTIGAYSYGDRYQFPIEIRDELKTQFNFYKNGEDYVKFVSNVDNAPFNFGTAGLTQSQIETYINNYITGFENCDVSGLSMTNLAAAMYSSK